MEEKLYFKPETRRQKKKDNQTRKKIVKIIAVLFFSLIIILIILYFLKGSTTTTQGKIPSVKNTLVSCSSESIEYPILTDDGASGREFNIKIVVEEEKIKSISLEYSLFYDSIEAVKASETHNHANMNISFHKAGLSADEFNAKYTILSDRMRMNLYATEKKLDERAKQYFLVEMKGDFPTLISELRKNYEAQGFTCETSE